MVVIAEQSAVVAMASKHRTVGPHKGHAARRPCGGAQKSAVPNQHRHRHSPRCCCYWWCRVAAHQLQGLILPLALAFVPPVLKPYLDLRGGELQRVRQAVSLRGGQVALPGEAALQLRHLAGGEQNPRPPRLLCGPRELRGGVLRALGVRRAALSTCCCNTETTQTKLYIWTISVIRRRYTYLSVCL